MCLWPRARGFPGPILGEGIGGRPEFGELVMRDVSRDEAATPGRIITERIGPTCLCPYEQEPLLLKSKPVVRCALLVETQSMRRAAALIVRRNVQDGLERRTEEYSVSFT
jgi:hypothetical protein